MINQLKVCEEMEAANLPVNGVRSDGSVFFSRELSTDEQVLVGQILANNSSASIISMRPRIQEIVADGVDVAHVVFEGQPLADVLVSIMCGETPAQQIVSIDASGNGELLLTCITPNTRIAVSADGLTAIVKAV
jgi:hypothetical protein